MLNMVTRNYVSDKGEGNTKSNGEIGLSGSMTRQVFQFIYPVDNANSTA
jgi:hypothetical protein